MAGREALPWNSLLARFIVPYPIVSVLTIVPGHPDYPGTCYFETLWKASYIKHHFVVGLPSRIYCCENTTLPASMQRYSRLETTVWFMFAKLVSALYVHNEWIRMPKVHERALERCNRATRNNPNLARTFLINFKWKLRLIYRVKSELSQDPTYWVIGEDGGGMVLGEAPLNTTSTFFSIRPN